MSLLSDLARAIGAVIVVMMLCELGLRLAGAKYEPSFYESDPVLYWALRPMAHGWAIKEGENYIQINSWGMRDRERSLTAPPGTTRIALLDASMIVAEQVPLEKTIGQVLEAKLQATLGSPGRSIEVLNFAVDSYTLAQELLILKNRVWAFHPTIVILFWTPNSVFTCDRHLYRARAPYFVVQDGQVVPDPRNRPPANFPPEERRRKAMLSDLENQIRLLQLVRQVKKRGIPQQIARLTGSKAAVRDKKTPTTMWFHPPSSPDQENAWRVAEGLLGLMAEDVQSHGAEFWVATIGPEIEENPNPEERANFLRAQGVSGFSYTGKRVESFAAAHGIKFISLEARLMEYAERTQLSLRGFFNTRPNYGHWNENGNAAAAAMVADSLLQSSAEIKIHPPVDFRALLSGPGPPPSTTQYVDRERQLQQWGVR